MKRDALAVLFSYSCFLFCFFPATHELLHKLYLDLAGVPSVVVGDVTVAPLVLAFPHLFSASVFPFFISFLVCLVCVVFVEKEWKIIPSTMLLFLFLYGCKEVFRDVVFTIVQFMFLL